MRSATVCLLTAIFAPLLAAQETTIRTTVPLVVAPTIVTDAQGNYVNGLAEPDFLLYDNGVPQKIQVDVSFIPISLVLAVQSSQAAAAALAKIRHIGSMIEPLIIGARGEAAILAYDDEVRVVQNFTADADALTKAVHKIGLGGADSRMIDATNEAVHLLAERRPPNRHRVLILVGEAKDRGSKGKLEDAVTLAQRENVVIYPVTYSAYLTPFTARAGTLPPPSGGGIDLKAIFSEILRLGKSSSAEAFSKYTGGSHLSFLKQKSLEQVVTRIGEELHSEYLLSFSPPIATAEEFHQIRVEVRDRPELRTRTRPGYWPAASEPQ
jgi:Ca-activated chloride channel family protein